MNYSDTSNREFPPVILKKKDIPGPLGRVLGMQGLCDVMIGQKDDRVPQQGSRASGCFRRLVFHTAEVPDFSQRFILQFFRQMVGQQVGPPAHKIPARYVVSTVITYAG